MIFGLGYYCYFLRTLHYYVRKRLKLSIFPEKINNAGFGQTLNRPLEFLLPCAYVYKSKSCTFLQVEKSEHLQVEKLHFLQVEKSEHLQAVKIFRAIVKE